MIPNTLDTLAVKAKLTEAEQNSLKNWIAGDLVAQEFAKVGQGGHKSTDVPLRRVFVDLPVVDPFQHHPSQKDIYFLRNLLEAGIFDLYHYLRTASTPTLREVILDDDSIVPKNGRRKNESKLSKFSACLLIGGPGQGKSTVGQLASQINRAALLKPFLDELSLNQKSVLNTFYEQLPHEQELKVVIPLLPLQVSLPMLSTWLARENRPQSDYPLIYHFISDSAHARESKLTLDLLDKISGNIPLLIVLDGFDEVGAAADRKRLVSSAKELLIYLAQKKSRVQVLATTRPQGYTGELAEIGIPLHKMVLAPLERDHALAYAKKLLVAKISNPDEQELMYSRMQEAADEPATARLMTTPLQVTILAALVQQIGRAPRERWNLFYRYFSYTYDREIERQTYASKLLAKYRPHIEQIHARVGLLLQIEAERDGGASARMTRSKLEEVIEAVLQEDEFSDQEKERLVADIAIAAENRLVFLVEPEPNLYGFEVRSFQEFMAAWAITTGRDNDVEQRVRQIAGSSIFRNVELFVASRFFSEASALRDIFASDVCGMLDSEKLDCSRSVTKAGAILSLEVLEEGAVLSQPKRGRALMIIASQLLSLPPSREAVRLARVANVDSLNVLVDQFIDHCLPEKSGGFWPSVWCCMVEIGNRGSNQAIDLVQKYWHESKDLVAILAALFNSDVALEPWFYNLLDLRSSDIDPESFLSLPNILTLDTASDSWAAWLAYVLKDQRFWRAKRGDMDASYLRPTDEMFPKLPIGKGINQRWKAWFSIAQFEINPSIRTLKHAIANFKDEDVNSTLLNYASRNSSWPLAVCARMSYDSVEFAHCMEVAAKGELGDIRLWRKAEEAWRAVPYSKANMSGDWDSLPWNKNTLLDGPPVLCLPFWLLQEVQYERSNEIGASAAEKTLLLFLNTVYPSARRWSATACLFRLRHGKFLSAAPHIEAMVKAAPDAGGLLFPRPRNLSVKLWKQAIQVPGLTVTPMVMYRPESLLFEAKDISSPIILALAVHSLKERTGRYVDKDEIDHLKALLERHSTSTNEEYVYKIILQIYCGVSPDRTIEESLEVIQEVAQINSIIWPALVAALSFKRLDRADIQEYLLQVYRKIGNNSSRITAEIIIILRDCLAGIKSGLDNPTVWNRLNLPLPFPEDTSNLGVTTGFSDKPIVIESIELTDVGKFRKMSLKFSIPEPNHGQWIVILGQNGLGKTTILRSLVLALRNTLDPSIWPRGSFRYEWRRIDVKTQLAAQEARINVKLQQHQTIEATLRPGHSGIQIQQSPSFDVPKLVPIFAYGCRRGSVLGGASREVNLSDDDGPEIATLMDDSASLIHAETWLTSLFASTNDNDQLVLQSVLVALTEILDLDEITMRKGVMARERGGPEIPFSALSDGYLTNAGWFLDLIARWIESAKKSGYLITSNFLEEMTGIVLIDEIDLHLHPRWQSKIIARTRAALPKMSFVVTTHNPLALLGAKPEEIRILEINNDEISVREGMDIPLLLTGGELYRRYFGIEDVYPSELGRQMKRYAFLSGISKKNSEEVREEKTLLDILDNANVLPDWDTKKGLN